MQRVHKEVQNYPAVALVAYITVAFAAVPVATFG